MGFGFHAHHWHQGAAGCILAPSASAPWELGKGKTFMVGEKRQRRLPMAIAVSFRVPKEPFCIKKKGRLSLLGAASGRVLEQFCQAVS